MNGSTFFMTVALLAGTYAIVTHQPTETFYLPVLLALSAIHRAIKELKEK